MANIGVVLGGGLAKGAYQAGLVKLLLERENPLDNYFVVGASVGSLNGYAFASHQIDYLLDTWRSVDTKGMKNFIKMVQNKEVINKYIHQLTKVRTRKNFHYHTICCEIPSFREKCFYCRGLNQSAIADILVASITIPPVMEPVMIDNKKYIDGAFRKNVPIDVLINRGLDYIIVMHFDTISLDLGYEKYANETIIELHFNEVNHVISDSFNFETADIDKMINYGYRKSKLVIDEYFHRIKNNEPPERKVRKGTLLNINGDYLLNRINKVMDKLKHEEKGHCAKKTNFDDYRNANCHFRGFHFNIPKDL